MLDGSGGARYFLIVVVYSWMRRFPQKCWWIDSKQNIHYDVNDGDVWHTTPDLLDQKYRQTYRMSFLAFEQLVTELTPFLRLTTQMFVKHPIPFRKQIYVVVY